MEMLDHYYGFVMYRHKLTEDVVNGNLDLSGVRDRGYLIIGTNTTGVSSGLVYRRGNMVLPVTAKKGQYLHILVENMGRIGFGKEMDDNHKGITSNVTLNGVNMTDWLQFPITMDDGFAGYITGNNTGNQTAPSVMSSKILPSVYVGSFMILDDPEDTYIDMSNWMKGQLFINGMNMGKYWTEMGPQKRLFVPKLFLQMRLNRVIIVELEGHQCQNPSSCSVEFKDQPLINGTVPSKSAESLYHTSGCWLLLLALLFIDLLVY